MTAAESGIDVLALDEALGRLEVVDPGRAALVEMRFFGGLTLDEAAVVRQVSRPRARKRAPARPPRTEGERLMFVGKRNACGADPGFSPRKLLLASLIAASWAAPARAASPQVAPSSEIIAGARRAGIGIAPCGAPAAHRPRGHRKEVLAALKTLRLHQTQVRLVHQCRRLERMPRPMVSELAPRDRAQVIVDQCQETVCRCTPARFEVR